MTTATRHSQNARSIAIQTLLGKDLLLLRRFEGEEGVSRLFHFDLELLSEQPSIDHTLIVGRSATVGLRLASGEDRFFNGLISRLSLVGGDGPFTVYRAELVPWTWLLTRTTDCRIFQNLSVPAIVAKVFTDLGLLDFKNRLTKVYPARDYCVQYRETDFNFVSRLMEQCGIHYFFEHENGKHTLILADSNAEHRPVPGFERAKYRASQSGKYEPDVISAWTVSRELRPAKYSLAAYNFETPNTNLTVQVDSPLAPAAAAKCEVYDYPGGFQKRAEGEEVVRVRIEEQETQAVTIRGTGSCRAMASGCRIELTDHPHQELNQVYVVTAVSHAVAETSYIPGQQEAGSEYRNSFTAVPLTVPYRPARVTPRPVIHGLQTAIVVGKKGEEIWVDKHGRVKVQFFWDREGKRDESSSCWVRVSQNWAGKRWGAMFLPRIGQEVIVEFLEGDPDCPIITGRVYNGDQMPPYDLPGEQSKTTLKSSSSKGGAGFNEWRFDDKAGAEQVFIHGQRDLDFVIERQARELIGEERHLIVTGSQLEQVGKEQHLKTGGDLIEDVGGDRFASAAKGFYVRAGSRLVLETGGEITLRAGGGFITIGAGGVNIQGAMVNINSGGAAGASLSKAVRIPNRAASALPGDATGTTGTGTGPEPATPVDVVELYRRAVVGEMSAEDKKEYEKALKELEAARARGDAEGVKQAKAKLLALERKASKLPEADRDAYEQALQELEAARDRGDAEGMKQAQAKLDAILAKNGLPIPVVAGTGTKPTSRPGAVIADRLQRDGMNFKAGGKLWKYRGVTGFRAPELFAKGETTKVDDYNEWMLSLGATIVRVFAIWNNTKYGPTKQTNYYELMERFLEHQAAAGLYVHLVGLCDQKPSNPDVYLPLDRQTEHLRELVAMSRRVGNVLFEISNEDTDPDSGNTARLFPRDLFTGVLTTRSSWAGDEDPEAPGSWLDWSTYHTPRGADFAAKGKVLHEIQRQGLAAYRAPGIPAVSGEPIRIAEGTTPRQHADDAAVCELYGQGRCLHGGFSSLDGRHQSDLQNCRIPTGLALDCCRAVSEVWNCGLIDPRCAANGTYVRGNEHNTGECPIVHRDSQNPDSPFNEPETGALRSFFMELDGRMYGLAVDPAPRWKVQPRNGWRLVQQGGYAGDGRNGNVLVLER